MDVEARCKCGHTVQVKDPFEGMVVLCTKCGGPMAVPRPLPGEGGPRVSGTPTRTRRRRFQTDPPWVLPLGVGIALLLIVGGVTAWKQGWLGLDPLSRPAPPIQTSRTAQPQPPPVINEPPEIKPPELPERPGFIRTGAAAPAAGEVSSPAGTGPDEAKPAAAEDSGADTPSARRVVASRKATKYHRPDCEWAEKISGDNRMEYGSPEAAEKADLKPCGVCKPDKR